MTPPEPPATGPDDRGAGQAPAVFACPQVLRLRADVLCAAQARRQATPAFTVQARARGPQEPDAGLIRVGYTASKKIGNAVTRNRAKRRLREIARWALPRHGLTGWDYVLVARPGATVSRDFAAMRADLVRALAQLHPKGAQ